MELMFLHCIWLFVFLWLVVTPTDLSNSFVNNTCMSAVWVLMQHLYWQFGIPAYTTLADRQYSHIQNSTFNLYVAVIKLNQFCTFLPLRLLHYCDQAIVITIVFCWLSIFMLREFHWSVQTAQASCIVCIVVICASSVAPYSCFNNILIWCVMLAG